MFSKYKLFPVVVHEYVVLEVDLGPRDGLLHFYKYEIRILLENLAYKHVSHAMFQNKQLPVVVHENVVLKVHLGPRDKL